MNSLQTIIRNKYLACHEKVKGKDLLTDEEYKVVSDCNLDDLLNIESTPSVLEHICEGEMVQTAEFYVRQESKYQRNVAKIYRRERVKPTLPRIVEVGVAVPIPARDVVPASATQNIPTDVPTETRSQQRDPYQMAEVIPEPVQPIVVPIADDNFGSNEVDGAREFLELCTGTNLPPMTISETATQDLLLAQLGIPVPPVNDNFQEISLRGIGHPLFQTPMKTSTPYVETVPRGGEPLLDLERIVNPFTDMALFPECGPLQAGEDVHPIVISPMEIAMNVPNEVVPIGEIPDVVTATPADTVQPVGQTQSAVQGALTRESDGSSVSTVEAPPPAPRSRKVNSFTSRLPILENVLPRPRRSFDIFSYHTQTNLYPMIEYVQSKLFQQQPPTQSRRLIETSLVMRAVEGTNATGPRAASVLQQSNDPGFVTPAENTSDMRSGPAPMDHSHLPDSRVLMGSSGGATNVPSLAPLTSIDGKMIEMSDHYRLPSFSGDTANNATTAAPQLAKVNGSSVAPKRQPTTVQAVRETARNEQTHWPDLSVMLCNQLIGSREATDQPPTARIDSMLLDILIVVQGEVSQQRKYARHVVTIQRLKQLLKIVTRIDVAKIMKNILLLKQARLLHISCSEDCQIQGVSIPFRQIMGSVVV